MRNRTKKHRRTRRKRPSESQQHETSPPPPFSLSSPATDLTWVHPAAHTLPLPSPPCVPPPRMHAISRPPQGLSRSSFPLLIFHNSFCKPLPFTSSCLFPFFPSFSPFFCSTLLRHLLPSTLACICNTHMQEFYLKTVLCRSPFSFRSCVCVLGNDASSSLPSGRFSKQFGRQSEEPSQRRTVQKGFIEAFRKN